MHRIPYAHKNIISVQNHGQMKVEQRNKHPCDLIKESSDYSIIGDVGGSSHIHQMLNE